MASLIPLSEFLYNVIIVRIKSNKAVMEEKNLPYLASVMNVFRIKMYRHWMTLTTHIKIGGLRWKWNGCVFIPAWYLDSTKILIPPRYKYSLFTPTRDVFMIRYNLAKLGWTPRTGKTIEKVALWIRSIFFLETKVHIFFQKIASYLVN